MFKVVRKHTFTEDLYLLDIEIAAIAGKAQPGHYVDIHLNPDSAPITVPVAMADAERGTITIVNRAQDLPSEQLMMLAENDEIFQIRGPLGSACTPGHYAKVVLAAEGLGVASLYWRAKQHREAGAHTIGVVGFPTRDHVFWQEEFSSVCDELYVVTDDGSYGVSGRITGPLQAICDTHRDVDCMVMIGSVRSMKRAAKIAADHGIVTRMSFDAVRPPIGIASIFDTTDDAQGAFGFARAAELPADKIDFEKLMARERAITKEAEGASAS